jgi:hypothetical protein
MNPLPLRGVIAPVFIALGIAAGFLVRSGLSTILLVYSAIAHGGDDAFAKWAAAHALSVTTLDSAGKDPDLLPLRSMLGAAHLSGN